MPTAMPAMMFVAGPVWLASAMLEHGAVAVLGVVLRDEHERDRRDDADQPAEEEVPPRVRRARRD